MERLLIIESNFSKDFFAKSQVSTLLFTAGHPGGFAVEAIAPGENGAPPFPLSILGIRMLKVCRFSQMLRQALAWTPQHGTAEIHCLGFICGSLGVLVKSRLKVDHKLVLYLDRKDLSRYSRGMRRFLANLVLRRAEYLLVETADDATLLNARFQGVASEVLTMRQLLNSPQPVSCIHMHPERLAMLPYCKGKGIDVGCGSNKTHPDAIGVDIVPGWSPGAIGSEKGRVSCADVCTSGDHLEMFADGSLDYIIARHNIEHYVDVVHTLREWWRVLRPGGTLALVIPDDEEVDTIKLDPSHKHAFAQESFVSLVQAIGGFEIRETGVCLPGWSFKCVLTKDGGP